jgi:capsular polysaccharide transport system permease protein
MGSAITAARRHARIIGALMMREIVTRFGREGAGFLWVIGEPMVFCVGVIILWSFLKPAYEHGVRIGPFVMTGYMCLMLIRHMLSMSLGAVQANVGLLYHRHISVIHIYIARNFIEFMGATVAFAVLYIALMVIGQVGPPKDWILLYTGWLVMAWVSFGIAFCFSALALKYEILEKVTQVVSYIMIPFSGAFLMVGWLPDQYREAYLRIPMPHGVEMVRAGVFGEFVHTYYHPFYAVFVGSCLVLASLILIADARDRVMID